MRKFVRFTYLAALLSVLAAFATTPLYAYSGSTFIEGEELMRMCADINEEGNPTNSLSIGCSQFVIGVHDTMSTLTFAGMLDKGFVCFPKEYTGPQLSLAVQKYLVNNPDKTAEPANMLVAVAFVEAYPCSE